MTFNEINEHDRDIDQTLKVFEEAKQFILLEIWEEEPDPKWAFSVAVLFGRKLEPQTTTAVWLGD